jgi:hypothetical protein
VRARDATALALAGVLAAGRAGAADTVSVQAMLHVRSTWLENPPGTEVLFDRSTQTFDLSRYLVGGDRTRYGSTYAAFSLQGSGLGGDLVWRVALDTGELRRTQYPDVTTVCRTPDAASPGVPNPLTGTGITSNVSLVSCARPPHLVDLEDTRLLPGQLTANGRSVASELRATAFVREAYAAYSFGRAGFATIRAGRKRASVADGYVYDDYATGAELALDVGAIGPPLSVTASLFQPTRDFPKQVDGISPFAALRVDWLPSLFEHAGLFLAVHRDRTGSVAELFRGAIVERHVALLEDAAPGTERFVNQNRLLAGILGQRLASDATMSWAGTSGRIVPWRHQRLGWTAAILRGRVARVSTGSATALPIAHDVRLDGRLLSGTWNTDLGDRVGIGAFFLHLSGGEFPAGNDATGTYRGFLGIAPFVTATNLFFAGGLSESFAARQSSAPGVNGRGVTAPGVTLTFDPVSAVGVDLKAAYLVAPVKGPFGGSVYGTEADAGVSWAIRDGIILGAELDVLWPGDFYLGTKTVYKAIVGLDVVTP